MYDTNEKLNKITESVLLNQNMSQNQANLVKISSLNKLPSQILSSYERQEPWKSIR